MTDIALHWDNTAASGEMSLFGGQLVLDDGLRTAILISLFTDARAGADDELPEQGGDRRGWWGNAFPENGQSELGSKLWLLERAKTVPGALRRAEEAARNALQWLIDDQIASSVDVTVERQREGTIDRLAVAVDIARPNGAARQRYDFVWEASA